MTTQCLFASEDYERIMYNINNEGNYTDYIFKEEHNDYTVTIASILRKRTMQWWENSMMKQSLYWLQKAMDRWKKQCNKILHLVVDTGSTGTMVQQRCLLPGAKPNISKQKQIKTTINGSLDKSLSVNLSDISLPEFVYGRMVDRVEARLFDSPTCWYDIVIFGRDFLRQTNMKLFLLVIQYIWWERLSITMKPVNHHYNMLAEACDVGYQPQDALFIQYLNLILDQEEELLDDKNMLLEQSCTNMELSEVVAEQDHLFIQSTKRNTKRNIIAIPKTFWWKIGRVPHCKFKIELLKPGSTPSFQRQFLIPYKYQDMFKKELQNMIDNRVMSKRTEGSQWVAPSFCQPEKDDRIRIVTDFR